MGFSVDFYVQLISVLLAIIYFIRKRNKIILYFIPFLLLTVSVECYGKLGTFTPGFGKFSMYNIFTAIEFLFYSFLFYLHLNKKTLKNMALFFIPFYAFAVIINLAFIQGLNESFHSYTFLLGSFFIVVFCCCFFYESILPDRVEHQLAKEPFFWICSGLLIFYLGSVIINALLDYLLSNDLQVQGKVIYKNITQSLNIILYTSFCIAFYLCPSQKKTYSLQS